jgi:hypothetical protein
MPRSPAAASPGVNGVRSLRGEPRRVGEPVMRASRAQARPQPPAPPARNACAHNALRAPWPHPAPRSPLAPELRTHPPKCPTTQRPASPPPASLVVPHNVVRCEIRREFASRRILLSNQDSNSPARPRQVAGIDGRAWVHPPFTTERHASAPPSHAFVPSVPGPPAI